MIPRVVVKEMRIEDLPAVIAIEAASFASPWTPNMLRDELVQQLGWRRVAMLPGRGIVGFMVARRYPDAWHVLDIAVAPDDRRRGVAAALLLHFLREADAAGAEVILEVRRGNKEAIALYDSQGFVSIGVRRGYYTDTREDALVMARPPGPISGEDAR